MRQYFRKCETEVYYEAMAKVLLTLLGILVLLIAGLSAYGIRFIGEASQTVNKISKNSNRISSKRSEKVSIDDKEPFSVLLLGLDTGGLGRTEQGRSDTMMVVTVNPKQKINDYQFGPRYLYEYRRVWNGR